MIERVRSDQTPARERAGSSAGGNYFTSPKSGLRFIPSGSKLLDCALGGGWVEERVSNIIGDRSSGKTLLATEAATNFAVKYDGGLIKYREAESAFDKSYAEAIGMPLDRVDFGDQQLETVEDMFDDISDSIKDAQGDPLFYICDSLDALSDRAEMGRDFSEATYGAGKAKMMSKLFRQLVREMSKARITLLIVSQIRDKMNATMFQKKWSRTGGKALDFYSSQTLFLAQLGIIPRTIKGVERPVGLKIKAKVDKNKVGLPYREAEFPIMFGFGIDDVGSCLTWLKEVNGLGALDILPLPGAKPYGSAVKAKPDGKAKKEKDTVGKAISNYLTDLDDMSGKDYRAEVKFIHEVVEKRWYAIENSFLPTRRKYG